MSRAPSPTPSTSSEASISEESQQRLMKELLDKAVKACTINTATDEAQGEELLTLTGEDDLPQVVKQLSSQFCVLMECTGLFPNLIPA